MGPNISDASTTLSGPEQPEEAHAFPLNFGTPYMDATQFLPSHQHPSLNIVLEAVIGEQSMSDIIIREVAVKGCGGNEIVSPQSGTNPLD
jgi:hypothetical protein